MFVGGTSFNPKLFALKWLPNIFPVQCSAHNLLASAALQDGWFTLCTRLFRGSDAVGYPEYVALATEKVTEFLNMESVRIWFFFRDDLSHHPSSYGMARMRLVC